MYNIAYIAFGFGVGTQPVNIQASWEGTQVFSGAIPTLSPENYLPSEPGEIVADRQQSLFSWQLPETPTTDENQRNLMVIEVTGGDFVIAQHIVGALEGSDPGQRPVLPVANDKKNVKINGVPQGTIPDDTGTYVGSWWYPVKDGETISYQLEHVMEPVV